MYVLLGALCGIAGLLQGARAVAATAQLGEGLELDVIAAVVVGGTVDRRCRECCRHHAGRSDNHAFVERNEYGGVDPYLQNIVEGTVLVCAVFVTIDRRKIGIIK
ncbi:ABC transporter permease [Mesorhizobium sp. B2-4-13]|uniref:ABC transporter permease n=1 Tax=Mesorhizobium sp. B2-4-13 TaxID=2589936 RepID=UPI00115242CC|nr:ABC transporter permease [Mesorhizobium sp. B2-4-13]TPK81012.1 ABC transporter permease [Mesorhizobium sp. B2-4-13]